MNAAIWPSSGVRMMLKAPGSSPPMYSSFSMIFGTSGLGPLRFAFDDKPLPLATKRWSPRPEIRTDVGYQPTGRNPSERACPRCETSKTARLFASALAIHSVLPLAAKARLSGVLPFGAWGCSDVPIRSSSRPVRVSSTLTLLLSAQAT